MSRQRVNSRPGSLVLAAGFLLLIGGAIAVIFRGGFSPKRDSAAETKSPEQRPAPADPLPLRRIADRPGAKFVLEAIEASGGYDTWKSRLAVRFRLDGVFFGRRGEIRDSHSEVSTLRLGSPLRLRIETADSSSVIGFGRNGVWGAGRESSGLWNPALGPGAMDRRSLRDLTFDTGWFFQLPFNLGEADLAIDGEPLRAPGDSLIRLDVRHPPAPGDTASRAFQLGFDPDSGHILEVRFLGVPAEAVSDDPEARSDAGASPGLEETAGISDTGNRREFILSLRGYADFDGIWRPTRRALFEADPSGSPGRRLYEQRLTEVVWDPPLTESLFEPPPAP